MYFLGSDHHDSNGICLDNVEPIHCCPHQMAESISNAGSSVYTVHQRAKDQLRLIEIQAKLGYIMLALLGEKELAKLGYPTKSVIEILKAVLYKAKQPALNEASFCSEACLLAGDSRQKDVEYQHRLLTGVVKLRIYVLAKNTRTLLKVCVPDPVQWKDFGFDGKSVDEILDDLCKETPSSQTDANFHRDQNQRGSQNISNHLKL